MTEGDSSGEGSDEDDWVAVETEGGDQRCYLCPEVFETDEQLTRHMEEVHEPSGVSKGDSQ